MVPDLSAVKFYDQTHYLHLTITDNLDISIAQHSLPDQCQWYQSTGTITNYLNDFARTVEELEEFYSNINTIDELCFVVDPVQPTTKHNSRIFKIGSSVSSYSAEEIFLYKSFYSLHQIKNVLPKLLWIPLYLPL